MTVRPTISWAETTRRSEALGEVIALIAEYLPPDSGHDPKDVISEIIRVVETRTGHRFLRIVAAE